MQRASICVIWIDWYSYHVARFRAISEHPAARGRAVGIELVGGAGVHQGMVFRDESRDGLNIQTLLPSTGWNDAKRQQLVRILWQRLNELDPETVLVPGYYTAPGLAAAAWAKCKGRRSILMTESTQNDHRRSWWKEALKGRLIRGLFDAAITGGRSHRSYLTELGVSPNRMGKYYDVVDNEFFSQGVEECRKCINFERHDLPRNYFLYVGRLAAEKNLSGLLSSFARVKDAGWDGSLVFVGDGPERSSLQAQARALGIENDVHFAGLKTAGELLPYYAFARAFVLPSSREPWGLVVNEAMASGLPVIVSSRCGCADDLVAPGGNGMVFNPAENNELTDALLHMAQAGEPCLSRMSARSQEIVASYSPRNFAEEVVRLAHPVPSLLTCAVWRLAPTPVAPPGEPRSSWLQVVSHLDPRYGGIAALLPMFCQSSQAQGVSNPIAGFCDQGEGNAADYPAGVEYLSRNRLRWMVDVRLREQMRNTVKQSDGVHIHGIWEAHCAVATGTAKSCQKPYIMSAHGMLERWALNHKKVKKALYAALIETNNLRRAACLRALTAAEVTDYRRIGLSNPVAIVPNGVTLPAPGSPDLFFSDHADLRGKRIVLFLGRLHTKKGLDLLMRAWAKCQGQNRNSHLVIAGPDFDGAGARAQLLAQELSIDNSVTFAGMLDADHKRSALAAAQVFVLPSFSEGFSVAVLEALAARLPVIVTRACNISEVAAEGCGWVIEPDQQLLEGALTEALELTPEQLAEMGDKGRAFVERRYTWDVVGRQMAEVYAWVLGGTRPSSVEIVT